MSAWKPVCHLVALAALVGASACTTSTSPPVAEPGAEPAPGPGGSSNELPSGPSGGAKTPTTPDAWGAPLCCVNAPEGFAVGQTLADLGVKDCDTGVAATIDDLCGAAATWVFAAHSHCPTCQATAGFTAEVAAAVISKNVAIVQTVYDDNGTTCAQWRTAYKLAGISNVRVYADPDGSVWKKLKTSNYTAPSAFLDASRIITHKEHSLSKAAVLAQIDAAIKVP